MVLGFRFEISHPTLAVGFGMIYPFRSNNQNQKAILVISREVLVATGTTGNLTLRSGFD